MGPKKETKGKKTKTKDEIDTGENGGILTLEDQIKLLKAENHSLQIQLADRQDISVRAISSKKELQDRIKILQNENEESELNKIEITKDMTRQYKAMQEELLNRINLLENNIMELKDQLEMSKIILQDTKKDHEEIILLKNNEIEEMKEKMEEMAQEFGDMLKETLDKMREKIEISNHSFDNDNNISMIRRMEEYTITPVHKSLIK